MSFDPKLASIVRAALEGEPLVSEKKMFGGIAFLHRGHMFCGIVGTDLMVRVGPQRYARALARPGVRPMDFTGRPIVGYVYVGPEGYRTANMLASWILSGLEFVADLPEPEAKKARPAASAARAAGPARAIPARPSPGTDSGAARPRSAPKKKKPVGKGRSARG